MAAPGPDAVLVCGPGSCPAVDRRRAHSRSGGGAMIGSSPAPFPCHESLCHERLPRLAEWLEWFFGLRLNERVTQLETFPESGCFVPEDPTRTIAS